MITLALALLLGAAAEAAPLTLRQAVDLSLERDTSVRKEREKLAESEASVSDAIAGALPQVSGQAQYSYRKDSLLTNTVLLNGEPYNSYAFGVQLTQRVFAGGAIWASYKRAVEQRDLQAVAVQIAERDLVAKAIVAYQGVWSSQVALRSLERTEAAQRESVAQAEKRYKVGLEKRLELLQMQAEMALVAPRILSARNALRLAALNLATLLGDASGRALELFGGIALPEEAVVDGLVKQASEPLEIRSLALQGQIIEETRTLEMARHWPSVSLVGNWGAQSVTLASLFNRDASAWNFGVQVNIPIFTGLSSVYERRIHASKLNQQQIDEEKARSELSSQFDKARKDLEFARALLKASEAALKTAREAEVYARETRKQATANYLQVFHALKAAMDAEAAYEQAKLGYLSSVTDYLKAAGLGYGPWVDALASLQGQGASSGR